MISKSDSLEKTIQFISNWYAANEFAVLVAIHPETKAIDTRPFNPKDFGMIRNWLEKYNGERNLYFHVNSVVWSIDKKARREDIKSMNWLHVDIDPREGVDLHKERDAILAKLLENRPAGVPEPTFIIFSGGGFQAFWKLKTPIEINGDIGLW